MADEEEKQMSLDAFTQQPPRRINLPSKSEIPIEKKPRASYRDLAKIYPHPPLPTKHDGSVIHRSVLHDLTGINQLLDWVSDNEIVIVEMGRLMAREVELQSALQELADFIEGDMGGQMVKITDTRLLLLPPGSRGIRGVEMEAFASDFEDDMT